MTRNSGIKKGGLNDPVAQSIRNQQNADAAPSADEVRAEHRKRLANEGCQVCDEDDPDVLNQVRVPLTFCGNDQAPRKPFEEIVLCDEHRRPSKVLKRARMVQEARNAGADVLAVYSCGATLTASWDVPDDDVIAQRTGRRSQGFDFDSARFRTKVRVGGDPPKVQALHVGRGCGAELTEVIHLDGGDR